MCLSVTVRELVVSAGESVEVTLPRSEVELNAYVVPTPPQGEAPGRVCKIPQLYYLETVFHQFPDTWRVINV